MAIVATTNGASATAGDNLRPGDIVQATSFEITELAGQRRTVTLTGRCLPFRPLATSIAQRFKKTLYTGASVASMQALGVDPGSTQARGQFSTRYMDDDSFVVTTPDGSREVVRTAGRAVQVMASVCKQGQMLRVSWGDGPNGVDLWGMLVRGSFPLHNANDIEWEADFEWAADARLRPNLSVPAPALRARTFADTWAAMVDAARGVLDTAQGAYRQYVLGAFQRLSAMQSDIDGLTDQAFDLTRSPADAARSAAVVARGANNMLFEAQNEALATQAGYGAVADAWGRGYDRGDHAFLPWLATGDAPDDSTATQVDSALLGIETDLAARRAAYEAARLARIAEAKARGEPLAMHRLADGDTLRVLSLRYYGSPWYWQEIADANGLASDADLIVGRLLVIPAVTSGGA